MCFFFYFQVDPPVNLRHAHIFEQDPNDVINEVLAAARAAGVELGKDELNEVKAQVNAQFGVLPVQQEVTEEFSKAEMRARAKGKAKAVEEVADKGFTRRSKLRGGFPSVAVSGESSVQNPLPPPVLAELIYIIPANEERFQEIVEDLSQQQLVVNGGKTNIYLVNFVLYSPTPSDSYPNLLVDEIPNPTSCPNASVDQTINQYDVGSIAKMPKQPHSLVIIPLGEITFGSSGLDVIMVSFII